MALEYSRGEERGKRGPRDGEDLSACRLRFRNRYRALRVGEMS